MSTQFEIQGAIRLRKLNEIYLRSRRLDPGTRELLKLFPIRTEDSTELVYERRNVTTGLQGVRGEGGDTTPAKKPGTESFSVSPGRYGDHLDVTESELERLREIGSWQEFESDTDQVARATETLEIRELDRIEYNIGQMVMNGVIVGSNVDGTEKDRQIFNIKQITPGTLFDNLTGSTPLKFIRSQIPILELGASVSFRDGFFLCSRPTINLILNNQNPVDFFGRRADYGATFNKLEDLNDFMLANDLPQFRVYNGVWFSDPVSPTARPVPNRFLTNGKMVLCGKRDDGETFGEYLQTRSAGNRGSRPGPWFSVEDRRDKTPFKVTLRRGHNGGCVPYYVEALACFNVAASNSSEFS